MRAPLIPHRPRYLRRFAAALTAISGLISPAYGLDDATALYDSVDSFVQRQTKGLPGKVTSKINPINTQMLSKCEAFDPFMPPGGKFWGKTTIGVRCLAPSSWTVYLQVSISVEGQYLVSARALTPGQTIGAGDVTLRQGDLTKLPDTVLTSESQAIGKIVRIGFNAGLPVRRDQLIAQAVVFQGQSVRTLYKGDGFLVSSEGKALNNATEGQVVQVRTSSGQIVSGIAREGGTVEISY